MRLVDSDVLIWNWRGQEAAATLLAAEPFALSAVSYMELVQGMRNARELKKLQRDLQLWRVTLLPITEAISQYAIRLVEQHYLAHHLLLADALIAATALEHQLELVTSNTKHFRPIAELRLVPYRAA
jgi:predicted nucleic acid-binding protein